MRKKHLLTILPAIIVIVTALYVVSILAMQEPCMVLDEHIHRCDYSSMDNNYRSEKKLKKVAREICNNFGRILDPDSMRMVLCRDTVDGIQECQAIEFMCAPLVYGVLPNVGVLEHEKENMTVDPQLESE